MRGMRGRRPHPDALKALKGNPGKKRLFAEDDMIVSTAPPAPVELPSFLTHEREQEIFRRVIGDFIHRRIARPADVNAYARWAVYLNRWMAAKEYLDGKHTFYQAAVARGGTRYVPAPQWKDMIDLEHCICSLEDRLGLNPTARQSIIRGLSTMPVDLGGIELRQKPKGQAARKAEEIEAPAEPPSPIGFGKLN